MIREKHFNKLLAKFKTHLTITFNTLYQVLSRVATAVVALLITKLLTRHLGVHGYGEYQIVLTYVSLFWILTDFGMNTLVVRETSSEGSLLQKYFSALLTARAGFGVALTLFALGGLFFLPYSVEVKLAITIGVLSIFLQAMTGASAAVFQVKLAYKYQLLTNLLGSFTLLIGLYLATILSGRIVWLAVALVCGYFVMMLVALFSVRKWVRLYFSRDLALIKNLLIRTIPFGVALLLSLATFKLDALLLSALNLTRVTNEAAVGIYNLGYKVFELAIIVPTFFMNVMYPILNRQFSSGRIKSFARSTFRAGLILLLSGVLSAAATYFMAAPLVDFLADPQEFADSVKVLQTLALGLPVFYLTPLLMFLLLIFRRQDWLVYIYATAFLFNLLSNLWLIPRYTYFAAAITTNFTEGLIFVLLASAAFYLWRLKTRSVA